MMSDPTKKISFGFSKLAKKTAIVPTSLIKNKQDDDVSKVEFIDCLEGKSIKLKDPVKQDTGPLVIPLTRIKGGEVLNQQVNSEKEGGLKIKNIDTQFQEVQPIVKSIDKDSQGAEEVDQSNKNDTRSEQETLDEIAAREILEELNKNKTEDDERRVFSVPLTSNAPLGEKESSLDDYENVPVGDFGLAMLRGMGWAPGKGIGKNEKLVAPTLPTPRPKGMGLGADKVIKSVEKSVSNQDLKMVKGSFIRVIAGPEKDLYGQIEGFDDESGRLIVKLALKNTSISLNEFMVQLVDSNEFKKNSKVINVSKYEEYKKDEVKKDMRLQDEVHDNKHSKESLNHNTSAKYDHKYKSHKPNRSSSSERQDDSKTKLSSNKPASSSENNNRRSRRSSKSPHNRNRMKEKSHSSSKYPPDSKYSIKHSNSEDKKHRSYSSDSSSSSSNYRNTKKQISDSFKRKNSDKDRSVSRQRSISDSSTSSGSSGHYSRKKITKHKKKKSSSKKYRSRSRSHSPRRHKTKKSKKYC